MFQLLYSLFSCLPISQSFEFLVIYLTYYFFLPVVCIIVFVMFILFSVLIVFLFSLIILLPFLFIIGIVMMKTLEDRKLSLIISMVRTFIHTYIRTYVHSKHLLSIIQYSKRCFYFFSSIVCFECEEKIIFYLHCSPQK